MRDKTGIRLSILAVATLQMCFVSLSSAISGMSRAFPGQSILVIQMTVNCINFITVFSALLTGYIARTKSKKKLCLAGLTLVTCAGFGGYFFHSSIYAVYLWSVVIGWGIGLFSPAATSMIVDYFDGAERNRLTGTQTAFINCGGVVLTFAGGLLAAVQWHYSYIALTLALPVLLICLLYLPPKNTVVSSASGAKPKMPRAVAYYMAAIFLFMIVYNVYFSNISLYITENGLGGASLAGTAGAVFMLGGAAFGLIFSKVSVRLKEYMFSLANFTCGLCCFLLYIFPSLPVLFIASFIGGCSISMALPQSIFSVSENIPPILCTSAIALIASVSPSVASAISPSIFNTLGRLIGENTSSNRYLAASVTGLLFAVLFLFTTRTRNKLRATD